MIPLSVLRAIVFPPSPVATAYSPFQYTAFALVVNGVPVVDVHPLWPFITVVYFIVVVVPDPQTTHLFANH